MKILVAEDEPKVRHFIQQALERAGMVVDAVDSVDDVQTAMQTSAYDVVVLDRLLHGHDSLDALPTLRQRHAAQKILVLSALAEVEERVKGLSGGADDYLGKPFHVAELVARVRALARPREAKGTADAAIGYDDLQIDLSRQRVTRGAVRIDLTGKEFRTLCLFARHIGHVFSKMEILNQVWDLNHNPESNVVEVTIANLRAKVDKGRKPLIQSRRGIGYWLGEP